MALWSAGGKNERHNDGLRRSTHPSCYACLARTAAPTRPITLSCLPSLDHLVGASNELRRDIKPERFGGFDVDDELDLGRRFNRKVGRLGAAQNPVCVAREPAI